MFMVTGTNFEKKIKSKLCLYPVLNTAHSGKPKPDFNLKSRLATVYLVHIYHHI
jgi:hypothetical protein